MYKKIAQVTIVIAIFLLAMMAVGFSAYGLAQSTAVLKTLNYQAGYQQCVVEVNAEMARQQEAAQVQANPQPINENPENN